MFLHKALGDSSAIRFTLYVWLTTWQEPGQGRSDGFFKGMWLILCLLREWCAMKVLNPNLYCKSSRDCQTILTFFLFDQTVQLDIIKALFFCLCYYLLHNHHIVLRTAVTYLNPNKTLNLIISNLIAYARIGIHTWWSGVTNLMSDCDLAEGHD